MTLQHDGFASPVTIRLVQAQKSPGCNVCSQIVLRPFLLVDLKSVQVLLQDLPALYPGGDAWLLRRLTDALAGAARCTLAVSAQGLAGITIETPKSLDTVKLSTLYVHPDFRHLGLGTQLLKACRSGWVQAGITTAYVTVDARLTTSLAPLLRQVGFSYTALECNRYGPGRDEMVFHWFAPTNANNHTINTSEYAEAIYTGAKRHEFRRVRASFVSGDRVLVYEPLPTGLVTGEFVVGTVHQGLPSDITCLETDPWSRIAAEHYLRGAHIATAIEVTAATKWEAGIKLHDVSPGIRPPQSYVFINEK